jgi:hypothetical protein
MEPNVNAAHRAWWNKGKIVGQKAPFKVKDIWALRVRPTQVRLTSPRSSHCSRFALTARPGSRSEMCWGFDRRRISASHSPTGYQILALPF